MQSSVKPGARSTQGCRGGSWQSLPNLQPLLQPPRTHRLSPQLCTAGPASGAQVATTSGEDAEAVVRAGFDPEGLFKSPPLSATAGDLFARRAALRAAAASGNAAAPAAAQASAAVPPLAPQAQQAPEAPQPPVSTATHASTPSGSASSSPQSPAAPSSSASLSSSTSGSQPTAGRAAPQPRAWLHPLRPLLNAPAPGTPEAATWRGIPAQEDCPEAGYSASQMSDMLATRFIPVNLSHPGMRVLHMDPPVLLIEDFATKQQCEALISAAEGTGLMAPSKIGAGNAASTAANAYDARRTSTSLLMDTKVQDRHPALSRCVRWLQRAAQAIFNTDERSWGRPGRLPSPGQLCYESPQVARYDQGQHFLSHEDAFPLRLARLNGFQRRATVLLYLNDVPQGGATVFDHLGPLGCQPRCGSVLVFFPAFSDGRPDERTLHTAVDAVDVKWVCQQWVAGGVSANEQAPPVPVPASTPPKPAPTNPAPVTFTISAGASSKNSGKQDQKKERRKKGF